MKYLQQREITVISLTLNLISLQLKSISIHLWKEIQYNNPT